MKPNDYKFTTTQKKVLEKLAEGKNTPQIAQNMSVTENTVNTHIKAIYSELDVHNRSELVHKVLKEQIVNTHMQNLP